MSDNAASGNANGQYSSPPFGMSGITDTGAEGSESGSTYGAYDDGRIPGETCDASALTSTGAPGSEPQTPPSDGGTVSATDVFGILNGGTPELSGTSNTNSEALDEPFTHQNTVSTGAGSGTPGHSDAGHADQSSPWENV